jgi:hypothetical protein
MLVIAGSIGAGMTFGWIGGWGRTAWPAGVAASGALAVEAAVLGGAAAAPVVVAGCAAGWSARAAWQRWLLRGAR